MEPVAGLQLRDHRVLADLVGLLTADRLVHRRVEARADGFDGLDPDGGQRLLELDQHHPKPFQELLSATVSSRVADRPAEVVEHGKEGQSGFLGRVPTPVGELLGLAPAEVLEVGGQAQQLVASLGELSPQALDLRLRLRGGFGAEGRHRGVREVLTSRAGPDFPAGSVATRARSAGGGDAGTGRRLAMEFHPDRNQGDKAAEEKFKEVGEAYSCLLYTSRCV